MNEGDVDEEEERGVVNVQPMSRVRWDERQEHLVQEGVGAVRKQDAYHNDQKHHHDAFQASNVYGSSAAAEYVRTRAEPVVFEYGV